MENSLNVYKHFLSLQDAIFSRIDHEDAMVALVFRVTQLDGKQLILKITRHADEYYREVYFLKHFVGVLPVPKIIRLVEPAKDTQGAILMDYIPGALLEINELTENLAAEIGRCLALIHNELLPGYGDPSRGSSASDPRINFTIKFEEGLEECSHDLPSSIIDKYRLYFNRNIDLLETVDGPCIVHRDYRPGNLIVQDGKLQGVIDWASARSSFAEEDFCSFEHGEWTSHHHLRNAFLAGYATIRPVPDYTRLMPLLRLNKAIATIGFTVKSGTWNSSAARLYQANRQFLEAFL